MERVGGDRGEAREPEGCWVGMMRIRGEGRAQPGEQVPGAPGWAFKSMISVWVRLLLR